MDEADALVIAGLAQSRKDIRRAAATLGDQEARYLVNTYYQVQEFRKAAANMARTLEQEEQPHEFTTWLVDSQSGIERDIAVALLVYARGNPTGQWALAQHGIGPIITAGLLAHIDIRRAPTCGHVWSFAGLNPAVRWRRGERRPWNADLKVLCWKIGDSFCKTSNNRNSFYGKVYRARKEFEVARDESGYHAETAARTLEERDIVDPETRKTYAAGHLPAGRLDLRARRVAVKMFLSHFHDVLHWHAFGARAPRPYAFDHLGHAHMQDPPHAPWAGNGVPPWDPQATLARMGMYEEEVRKLREELAALKGAEAAGAGQG